MPDGTQQDRLRRRLDLDEDGLTQWRLSGFGNLTALEADAADAAVAEAAPIPALPDEPFTRSRSGRREWLTFNNWFGANWVKMTEFKQVTHLKELQLMQLTPLNIKFRWESNDDAARWAKIICHNTPSMWAAYTTCFWQIFLDGFRWVNPTLVVACILSECR